MNAGWPAVLAISAGASIGAVGRWQLGVWLNQAGHWLPWGTWVANALGAYLIGLGLVFFQAHPQLDPQWRLALITGFLGALTTFSTFSAEALTLLQQGRWLAMAGHSLAHWAGSLALCGAGIWSARQIWP